MIVNQKDLGAGLSFLGMAIVYGWVALRELPFGSALAMGPGYFPIVLCMLLGVIGSFLTIRALCAAQRISLSSRFSWRPVTAICLAVIIFGTFIRELGLFLSVFGTAFICSLASRQFAWKSGVYLAVVLAILCTGIFAYGVRLPLPVIGTWFTG
ncbi:tripartite tricarboxylate transporter TctB family protein [Chelatococcus asaccharovorans]|uniref:tripartite tricarboxylate transporter TctB family protein n=1 Tax=Chelatococcus asaccharovorans TaxID=28210 RepID=UPI00224C6DB4|nr:tripartite tricarboxylate transporter TctB family protein [Chelatococcus asaccharovorans]CAH1651560.1 Tripartite tricarboxylate transporter TctB family protein [Chelatococcus asaccharovorans]CAH1692991.1 Tripartite tricarboxylate transporter TctB family protein [Chelatococcus asaccharovorans]